MKLVTLILSALFVSFGVLAQPQKKVIPRYRINTNGDVAVLNLLFEGKAVDIKNLVSVSTPKDGLHMIRIEKTILPGTLADSIKLIFPTTACERLPAYTLFREQKLFFFLDDTKRKSTLVDAVCDKVEISYTLDYFNLQIAEAVGTEPGLLFPKVTMLKPFAATESQNINDFEIPTQSEGTYTLSITRIGTKITTATLSVLNTMGQAFIIQTLPAQPAPAAQ